MVDRYRPRLVAVVVTVAVALPLLVLAVQAFADAWRAPALVPQRWGLRGIEAVLRPGSRTAEATVNSTVVAVTTTALAVVLGWPAARALGERRVRHRAAVALVLALPLLVPPYAIGTGLATWLLRLGLADTLTGLVAAHLVYVLPYVTVLLVSAFDGELRRLEDVGRTAGLGRARRLWLVTIPTVLPELRVAVLLGLLISWSQYGTSLAVGGGIPLLPLVLVPFVGADPQLTAALSLVFLAPAMAALAATQALGGQRTARAYPAARQATARPRPQSLTRTPRQNATWPAMRRASGQGRG